MTTQSAPPAKKPDRVLGDEWDDWTGDLDESATFNETARLFAVFASLAIFLIFALTGFVLYMIEPRLRLLNPALVLVARVLTIGTITAATAWLAIMVACVFTGWKLLPGTRFWQVSATSILPPAMALARRMGISRDRIGNSFVAFSNHIVRATYKPGRGRTIILLPRCLNPGLKKQVQELGERSGVGVFTASGGGQARNIIRQQRPSSVIGVACERDLMSGIHDVAPKMPTIGVTNQRPEGPCKNTTVNLEKVKNAIMIFTGVPLD